VDNFSLNDLSWWYVAALILLVWVIRLLKGLVDIYAHPYLARLGWRRIKAPPKCVQALFDGYAKNFDEHLLRELEYAAPNLISGALNEHLAQYPHAPRRALDLGCGTGICGVLLKPRVQRLIGVDLSQAMLREAEKRGVYDALYEADMLLFLRRQRDIFDLITAADVLVYLGDLKALMQAVAAALTAEGVFIFTTEELSEPGYKLMATGCFGHHPDYIATTSLACGLLLESQTSVTLRLQSGDPVRGHVHVLRNGVWSTFQSSKR